MQETPLKGYFKEYISLYPSFASFLGDRRADGGYENVLSRSHNIRYGRLMKKYAAVVEKYRGPRTIDIQMLKWIVNDDRASQKHPLNLMPMSSFENWVVDFSFVNKSMYPLETLRDLENLLKRHHRFLEYIECAIDKMKVGIRQRIVLPKVVCEPMVKSLEAFYKEKRYVVDIPDGLAKRHPKATQRYISFAEGPYAKAVAGLIAFIRRKYLPACRDTAGICGLPGGKRMYKYLVRSQTTLDITAERVHAMGLREVKRIASEMNAVKVLLGYPASLPLHDFNNAMLGNKHNYYAKEEALMREYKKMQRYIDDVVIPANFHHDVDRYDIKRVPRPMEATSAGAFYYPGSALSSKRRGTFYVNMRDMKENPRFNMMALSLHEGKPGHHYQFQYMIEAKTPLYRQYSVNGTAFVEGWALYAETLGDYKNNPYDYFGKLTYEMFRAVRLVVDTGLHHFGWTYEEAVEYMTKHLAITPSEIETEVQRYICIPGQALCYKIGERKISALKQMYLKAFGHSAQSVKDFHRLVLEDGILPLSVLEKKVRKVVKDKMDD